MAIGNPLQGVVKSTYIMMFCNKPKNKPHAKRKGSEAPRKRMYQLEHLVTAVPNETRYDRQRFRQRWI